MPTIKDMFAHLEIVHAADDGLAPARRQGINSLQAHEKLQKKKKINMCRTDIHTHDLFVNACHVNLCIMCLLLVNCCAY